jgi:hypothetical protein
VHFTAPGTAPHAVEVVGVGTCTWVLEDAEHVKVTVPLGTVGTYDLLVTDADGNTATLTNAVHYIADLDTTGLLEPRDAGWPVTVTLKDGKEGVVSLTVAEWLRDKGYLAEADSDSARALNVEDVYGVGAKL